MIDSMYQNAVPDDDRLPQAQDELATGIETDDLTQSFVRLCNLPTFPLDRLGRHEGALPAYNRFNRWRKAGVWDRLMDAVTKAHDGSVQMIDSSIVRVHQHASGVKKRVEIVVWGEAAAGSPRKSTRASMAKADRSSS
jgi:hypothetical protein